MRVDGKLFVTLCMCITFVYAYAQGNKQPSDTLKKELQEVVVKGNRFVTTSDKILIYADESVKKHSYDGYSALYRLNVPGLEVDAIGGGVSANGQGVLLCINGVEASQKEIKALNPRDILRIDYYTNFDPKHPEAGKVIDYIMKVRDYGGAVVLQATQSLNVATGNDMADWKMFKKKAEFGINVSFNTLHNKPDIGTNSVRNMVFDNKEITRISESMPSSNHSNSVDVIFTYLQRLKNGIFKSAVGYSQGHAASGITAMETYAGMPELDDYSQSDQHNDNKVPSFYAMYDHFLKKGYLHVELSGSYYAADIAKSYHGLENIVSSTQSEGYRLIPKLRLTIPMGKFFTPYAWANYCYSHRRQTYIENGVDTRSPYTYQGASFGIGSNIKLHKNLSATISLQNQLLRENPDGRYRTSYTFSPSMDVSYNIPNYGQLATMISYYGIDPPYGKTTGVEKKRDEFLVTVGNPDLKQQKNTNVVFSYTNPRSWGWMQVFSEYNNTSRVIYADYKCDNERGVYVQSYKNGKKYELFKLNYGVEYRVVPNCFNVSVGVTYLHTNSYTYRRRELDRVRCLVGANFMYRGFSADASFRPQSRDINQDGDYVKKPVSFEFNAGYNVGGWSFSFFTRNPFMRTYEEVILKQPGYSRDKRSYSPKLSYDYFAVRISYRFNYGKPHRFQNFGIGSDVKGYVSD